MSTIAKYTMGWRDPIALTQVGWSSTGFLIGFVTAGYLDLLPFEPFGLFVPGMLLLGLVTVSNGISRGLLVDWLVPLAALLGWLLVAAMFGVHAGWRAAGFAIFTGLPILGLAIQPGPGAGTFTFSYATGAALGMAIWIFASLMQSEDAFKPWGIAAASASANTYGVHLNMLWPLLLHRGATARGFLVRQVYRGLALAAVLAAVATMSRLAVATAALIAVLLLVRARRFLILGAMACTLAVAASIYPSAFRVILQKMRLADFEPKYGRSLIWQESIEQVQGNLLFGQAPGGAKYALGKIDMYHAHNDVLHLALEAGLPAALLGIAITMMLALTAITALRRRGIAFVTGCSILAFLASTLVSSSFTRPELTLSLVLILGIYRYAIAAEPVGLGRVRSP